MHPIYLPSGFRIGALILLGLFMALWMGIPQVAGAHAADGEPRTLKVPVNAFPPWIIVDKKGIHGIDIDILNAVGARMGLRFTYVECPWLRCLRLMEGGAGDLMSGLFRSPDREKYLAYIDPPYYQDPPKVFYTLADRPKAIHKYDDLKGLSIGVVAGTLYFPRFDNDTQLEKQVFHEEPQLVRLLGAGRIDTFISTEVEADILIEKAGLSGRFNKSVLEDAESGESYFALSRLSKHQDLAPALSETIRQLKASGELVRIIQGGLRQAVPQ